MSRSTIKILVAATSLIIISGCGQKPKLTLAERQAFKLIEDNAQTIVETAQASFAESEIGRQLGSDFRITGISVGVGPSHPSEKYCSCCIDTFFGFPRVVVRCCEPSQGTQCQPCYDGKEPD